MGNQVQLYNMSSKRDKIQINKINIIKKFNLLFECIDIYLIISTNLKTRVCIVLGPVHYSTRSNPCPSSNVLFYFNLIILGG